MFRGLDFFNNFRVSRTIFMKFNLHAAASLVALFLFGTIALSQPVYEGIEAERLFSGATLVRGSHYSDLPSFIRFKPGAEPEADNVMTWLSKNFQLDPALSFQLKNSNKDGLGFEHFRFEQTYNGHTLEDATWILHVKNDKVVSMNGMVYQNLPQAGSFTISAENALQKALDFVGAETYKWEVESEENHLKTESGDPNASYYPVAEKVYVSSDLSYRKESFRAAYRFNIYAHSELYRAYVYVDAATGEILTEEEIIHDIDTPGTAVTVYSGTKTITTDSFSGTFRLRETGRGDGINTYDMNTGTSYGAAVDFTDTDNNWNNVNAQLDQYATDAHWGAEMTYDYYFNIHGRNSIDDNGFALNSYVHYDVNYANAFWDGTRMTYGDGDGSWDPLVALDIAGHEITHGLTEFTAGLNYSAESGALNESFSDIFGTAIENYGRPTDWNWLIGDEIGATLRSMSNPNAYGDPDTYFGTNWASLTGGDNGGVHTNSGVQNYWYYLMVAGGSGTNDQAESYNVTGLGFNDASEITFRNLTVYLTATSDYAEARFFAIQSAIDLFGACTPQVETTTNAWYAVGVGNAYLATVIADFSAPVLTSCSAPFTVNFNNTSTNGTSFNWNFGDGGTSTLNNPSHTYTTPGTYTVTLQADGGACGTDDLIMTNYITIDNLLPCVVNMPASGTGNVQTACSGTLYDSGGPASNYGANEDAQITITPFGATSLSLTINSFDVEAGSSGTNCNYDYLRVYNGPSTTSPLIGTYCNNNLPPATINSSGGSLTLVFHSDGGLEEGGFDIDWNCTMPTTPPVTNFIADVTTTCNGSVTFTDLTTNGATSWAWNFGDGNTSTLQNPSNTYTTNGTYTVTLTATNAFGSDPEVKTNYIVVNKPAPPAVTGTTICENNTANLSTSGTGTLNWYDAASGGTLINTGLTYTTPVLTSSTTYYVEQEVPGDIAFVGPATNAFGTGGNFNGDQHQVFTCLTPVILKSVKVYANGAGNRTIQLRDNLGTVLQQAVVNIPNGTSTVTLNFDVPVGTNLQLGTLAGSSPSLYRNNAGASYPYTLPGQISITSSSAGSAFYYFFYNWEIEEYSCLSERAPVTATVNPSLDATIAPVSALCTTDAPVTLSAVDAGGTWSGTGVTGASFDPAAAGTGNHTVTYTIPGMCGSTDTEIIAVSDGFDATINAVSALCSEDSPITLTGADAGGTWSGTGITNPSTGSFDPSVAGAGTHTVTYTFSGSCGDSDTETITVNAQSDATITPPTTICEQDAALNLTAAESGGVWSGTGITNSSSGTFDPTVSGTGTFPVTYTLSGTCGDTDTQDITVTPQSDATILPVSPFCLEGSAQALAGVQPGGTWSATCGSCINATTGEFDPSLAGEGNWTVTYTVGTTCPDTKTTDVLVRTCLGLNETQTIIRIYPNPAHESILLTTGGNGQGTLIITDLLGREIERLTLSSNSTLIPLGHFADGSYLITVLDADGNRIGCEQLIKE